MQREFDIVPPETALIWVLPAMSIAIGIAGIAFGAREDPRAWFAMLVLIPVIGVLTWSVRRRRVSIDGETLVIAAGINTARVKVSELQLDAARIVNLDHDSELRPRLKTMGTSMPGYRAGHFRLRDRRRAFVLVTRREKLLALPERNGRMLLLSLKQPQALLDALGAIKNKRQPR
ncbi:MAG: hypothetical protein E6Q88_00080 [Lysobacteraceae bacterium]|nr:MAG: hypothetical protein E6Q88_00080 [Xanthomonadaceae bacterium]